MRFKYTLTHSISSRAKLPQARSASPHIASWQPCGKTGAAVQRSAAPTDIRLPNRGAPASLYALCLSTKL